MYSAAATQVKSIASYNIILGVTVYVAMCVCSVLWKQLLVVKNKESVRNRKLNRRLQV